MPYNTHMKKKLLTLSSLSIALVPVMAISCGNTNYTKIEATLPPSNEETPHQNVDYDVELDKITEVSLSDDLSKDMTHYSPDGFALMVEQLINNEIQKNEKLSQINVDNAVKIYEATSLDHIYYQYRSNMTSKLHKVEIKNIDTSIFTSLVSLQNTLKVYSDPYKGKIMHMMADVNSFNEFTVTNHPNLWTATKANGTFNVNGSPITIANEESIVNYILRNVIAKIDDKILIKFEAIIDPLHPSLGIESVSWAIT